MCLGRVVDGVREGVQENDDRLREHEETCQKNWKEQMESNGRMIPVETDFVDIRYNGHSNRWRDCGLFLV